MNEHGSYRMELIDQVLVLRAYGAWNLETTQRWSEEYLALADKLKAEPWACLVDLTEWGCGPQECIPCVDKVNEWGNVNNQSYEVVICQSLFQQKILKGVHQKLSNVETEFFQDESQAWQWLQSVGICHSLPRLSQDD